MCQMAVRQRLRDPDSADFPFMSPPSVQIDYLGETKIKGYLHANNGLGLKIRVDYFCDLKVDREGRKVKLLDAQLIQR